MSDAVTCTGSGGYWVDMEDSWGGKHTQFYDCEKCGENHSEAPRMGEPGLTTALRAWLADVLLGPPCPLGCGYRARGPRSLQDHVHLEHAGDRA